MAGHRQIRVAREGLCYTLVMLAMLSGAIVRQLNLLMLVGSVMAGLLLFAALYGRFALRRMTLVRKLPRQLHADQRLVVDVSLTNHRRWLGLWGIEVEDRVEREGAVQPGETAGAGVFFAAVAGGDTRQVAYRGWLPRRGLYRFGPLRVSTRFPLGLIRHTVILDESAVLMVHPKLGRLTHNWAETARVHSLGGRRMQRRGLLEADYYGLRDWRAGDSRRWIHWRTSARRNALVVRQFEQRRSQDLALLVDLWQPVDPGEEHLENVETAVSFVATLIAEACRQSGRQLSVVLAAREHLTRCGPASLLFFRDQMDALSLAAAHNDERLPESLGHALVSVPPATPTLVISTRPIDWEALRSAADQRDARASGRPLQGVNVAGGELERYFQG